MSSCLATWLWGTISNRMESVLEVWYPYLKSLISQGFAANANPLYKGQGLKGHPALDFGAPWGDPIPNTVDNSYCFSVLNRDNPDPTKYRAIFMLVETKAGIYEVSYGHCSEITAKVGNTYMAGDIIGKVGNTGAVYSGGIEVTKEARLKGSKAGAHVHYQVRLLEKVAKKTGRQLIYDGNGVLKRKGFYYEVPNYNNGYNGCVDPTPFWNGYYAGDAKKRKGAVQNLIDLLKKKLASLKP